MTPIELAALVAAPLVGFASGLGLAACMLASRVDQATDSARARAASEAAEDELRREQ